jgi:pilus assembly protein CpaB
MKQRNLILMVVAVGCGLVAAFLTSQMSAGPKGPEVQLVDVVVAKKELPPGTRFTKDSLKDQVKRKKYKPDELPDNAVTDEAELVDKQLTKTLRADDYIAYGDLGTYKPLVPPAGKDLITIRMTTERTTPFLKPGDRVDILGTGVTRKQQVVGLMVLPNVLVMAEGVEVRAPNETASGKQNISMVTVAVSTEEAMLIRMCETANLQLSCILRSEDGDRTGLDDWSINGVKRWLAENHGDGSLIGVGPAEGVSPQPVADVDKIRLPVPTEDLPAGTPITAELIAEKFKEVEFLAPAPDNAVTNIKEHIGRYLLEKVAANQIVPKSFIGDKLKPEPAPREVQPAPKPQPERKRETFDRSFTTTSGTKWYRYEKQDDGAWKLIGEVKEDGSVVPVQGNAPPAAKPNPNVPNVPDLNDLT